MAVKMQWQIPSGAGLVLSEDACAVQRKTSAGWKSIVGTVVFEAGVHRFAIHVPGRMHAAIGVSRYSAGSPNGTSPFDCLGVRYSLGENAPILSTANGSLFGLQQKDLQLQAFGVVIEFEADMDSHTLKARESNSDTWVTITTDLPDAVRPFAALGSAGKTLTLRMPVVETSERTGLAQDLLAVFQSGSMSDVTVVAGDVRVPAHSLILSARSKVFAAMLQAPMKEAITRELKLKDVDPDILQHFLQFLYTEQVPDEIMVEHLNAVALLQAAHCFEVPQLENFCVKNLADTLQVDTAAALLQVADTLNCAALRSACLAFVSANVAEVQTTSGFKHMAAKRPALMLEVIAAIAPPAKKPRQG